MGCSRVGLGEGSILIFMTPAYNAGGNQDLSSTRKGAQNSGSGKPAKKHNSPNRKNNKGNQAFMIHDNFYGVQFHPEFSWEVIKKYVFIRSAMGVKVDDPFVPESTQSELVLFNFIDLFLFTAFLS